MIWIALSILLVVIKVLTVHISDLIISWKIILFFAFKLVVMGSIRTLLLLYIIPFIEL